MELAIVQKHSPPFGFLSVSNKSVKRKRKATTNMNANEPKDGMSHVTKKSHKHSPSSLSFQWPNETKIFDTLTFFLLTGNQNYCLTGLSFLGGDIPIDMN